VIANPTEEEELKEFQEGYIEEYLALEHNLQEKIYTEMDFHGIDIAINKTAAAWKEGDAVFTKCIYKMHQHAPSTLPF
jgi:phage regulator Rha-like protein